MVQHGYTHTYVFIFILFFFFELKRVFGWSYAKFMHRNSDKLYHSPLASQSRSNGTQQDKRNIRYVQKPVMQAEFNLRWYFRDEKKRKKWTRRVAQVCVRVCKKEKAFVWVLFEIYVFSQWIKRSTKISKNS